MVLTGRYWCCNLVISSAVFLWLMVRGESRRSDCLCFWDVSRDFLGHGLSLYYGSILKGCVLEQLSDQATILECAEESQLQSKTLRWLGHMFRMTDDRLPKKLLFGHVQGCCLSGCHRSQ